MLNKKISISLKQGSVGVLPTDTIYGIVGSAFSKKTVARIYRLRKRSPKKPMIILVSSVGDVRQFGIRLNTKTKIILRKLWPGKISVVFPCGSKKFVYLHRGTKGLAFRLPKPLWLRRLIRETGPLVAPSANWEGRPSAKTIKEAKKYFGPVRSRARVKGASPSDRGAATSNGIDFYFDAGKLDSKPSTLVVIKKGKIIVLREGAVRL